MGDEIDDGSGDDIAALVRELLAAGEAIAVSGGDAYALWTAARSRVDRRLAEVDERIVLGEDAHGAVDEALTYLELDPYYFWSGFSRARMARRLAHAPLDSVQRERARRYVLECVAGTKHCAQSAVGPLAHSVADNPMRRALRSHLHSSDAGVARRALRTLAKVRHPGLTQRDIAIAREIVLEDATQTWWLPPNVERLARWLWTPEWEAELRALTKHHDPDRASAKKLLESVDRRRAARRPGP